MIDISARYCLFVYQSVTIYYRNSDYVYKLYKLEIKCDGIYVMVFLFHAIDDVFTCAFRYRYSLEVHDLLTKPLVFAVKVRFRCICLVMD